MDVAADRHGARAFGAAPLKREHFTLTGAFASPASETERQLLAIWEAVLDIEGLGVDDDFFELSGESLAAVTLFSEMERFLGEMPPLSILLDYPTIRRLAACLDQLGPTAGGGLVVPLRAQGRHLPLFNAHAAYGNVLFGRKLLPYLDAEQPYYAVQARGMREGETPHRTFEAMAADYVAEVRRIQPVGPYFLTGHCVGGLIAFEMAQRLKNLGQDVAAVIMIDPEYHPNAVPWLHWRNPDAGHVRLWLGILRPVWFTRRWLGRIRDRFAGRPLLKPPTDTSAHGRRQKAVIVGLVEALRAYRPRRYEGRLVVLCSAERRKHLSNPTLGWSSLAPQAEFIEIGSSHDEVFFGALPAVGETLARILSLSQPTNLWPLERVAAE